MNTFNGFTGLYPLSKTLRFELKPIGKTLQFIINNGILEQDKHRADSYSQVKEIINEYHKAFIERGLTGFELKYNNEGKKNSLLEYFMYYNMGNSPMSIADKILLRKRALIETVNDELKNIAQIDTSDIVLSVILLPIHC